MGALSTSTQIQVYVTLKPSDPAGLARFAAAVATPGSPLYRHYLTVAQFRQRFGPTPGEIAAVESSLRAHGLRPGAVSANGLAIPIRASAGGIEHAFALSFDRLALPSGRTAFANTQAPQFDSSVAPAVQAVVGLDSISVPRPRAVVRHPQGVPGAHAATGSAPRAVTGGPQPCQQAVQDAPSNGAYTADQLASAYRLSSLYGTGDEGAGQTIALFELEPNSTSDIAAYQSCYGTNASVTYVPVDGGAGAFDPAANPDQGVEAELDIEDVIGLAPKANVRVYQGPNAGSGAYDTYSAIVNDDLAKVISTSWGLCEADEQGTSTAQAENTLFQEAAAQGQSVFAAAGDSGSEDCSYDGSGSLAVDDPASQPYVTGVGGTTMSALGPPATESVWNERAAGAGAGGGGISSVWTMPSYQASAPQSLSVVNGSSSGSPCGAAAGGYCREVPDVAADADPYTGYLVYYDGGWTGIGGTSAAAPLWAAFMALVNASSACNGTPVGFANPALYRAAASGYSSNFSDITAGNNDYGGSAGGAFGAGAGYDMASGLGTPIGSALPAALCGHTGSGGSTITVTNPGNQTSGLGSGVSVPISASDSAAGATLTYSQTGLPAGLSIDPATGVISGTPAASGSSWVMITVSDDTGASSSVSFTWTVTLRGSGSAVSCSPAAAMVGWATTCTATVSDSDAGQPSSPSGTVTFGSSSSGWFASGGACTLGPAGAGAASCSVTYQPLVAGGHQITAVYAGDAAHRWSSGSTGLSASAPPAAGPAPSGSQDTQITGTPRAGAILTCPSASAASPGYQWTRNGTPIAGAVWMHYAVQPIDEGTTLTCVVTAASAAGVRAPVASASVRVAVPVIGGCPAARGGAGGITLGLIRLGMTRQQARRAYAHSTDRASRYTDTFCLTPIGIRAGYASPRLLGAVHRAQRNSLAGRVVWISTGSASFALDGVRVGATLGAAAQHLRLGHSITIGRDRWYLATVGGASVALDVRGGIVQQIALAATQLARTRSAQRALLSSL